MPTIKQLPNNGFAPSNASIAGHLREQADWIDEDPEPVRNVYIVIERADGTLKRQTVGMPCDTARLVGILTIACIRAAMMEEE